MEEHWSTKCRSFETDSIEEMEDALNEFFNNKWIVSSPIFDPRKDDKWRAMVYYKVSPLEIKEEVKPTDLATEKQLDYLKRLGYKGNLNISMTSANKLIKSLKEAK